MGDGELTGPHIEPLMVYESDGLCLPNEYVGYDGGLVARMPNGATIDCKPREWGAFFPTVQPRHFGEDGSGANSHLGPYEVELKKYGQESETFSVDCSIDVDTDQ